MKPGSQPDSTVTLAGRRWRLAVVLAGLLGVGLGVVAGLLATRVPYERGTTEFSVG